MGQNRNHFFRGVVLTCGLALLLAGFSPVFSLAESYDEMYKRVFGKTLEIKYFPQDVALKIDNRGVGDISLQVPSVGNNYKINAKSLLTLMAENLKPGSTDQLVAMVDPEGYLSGDALAACGFRSMLDRRGFVLQVSTPVSMRLKTVIRVGGDSDTSKGLSERFFLKRAMVAGYLNAYNVASYDRSSVADGTPPTVLLDTRLEGRLNLNDLVVQADGSYQGNAKVEGRMFRVIKDLPNSLTRYTVGDLDFPVIGEQSNASMTGFSMSTGPILNPNIEKFPQLVHRLDLKTDAKVKVVVNDGMVQDLDLEAGQYEFTDFPLRYGVNLVKIEVTPPSGNTEIITIPFVRDLLLYDPKFHEFSYGYGWSSSWLDGRLSCDIQNPQHLFYYRQGINSFLTGGAYFQTGNLQRLYGADFLYGSGLGPIQLGAAKLDTVGIGPGYSVLANFYNYPNPNRDGLRIDRISYGTSFRTHNFVEIGGTKALNYDLLEFNSSFTIAGYYDFLFDLRYSARFPTTGTYAAESYQSIVSVYKPLPFRWVGQLTSIFNAGNVVVDRWIIQCRLSWDPVDFFRYTSTTDTSKKAPVTEYRLRKMFAPGYEGAISYLTEFQKSRLAAEFQADRALLSASQSTDGSQRDWEGGFSYRDPRAIIRLNQGYRRSIDSTSSTSRVGLDTSLVFADGVFGISQPVRENFVMVAGDKSLAGQTLLVNEGKARMDFMGPAVIPDIQRNRVSSVVLDTSMLPPGSDVGNKLFEVSPTFYQGYLVRMKATTSIIVAGEVFDQNDRPLGSYKYKLRDLGNPKADPQYLLTSRRGTFQIPGIQPGKYELTFSDQLMPVILQVPEVKSGYYNAGKLQVRRRDPLALLEAGASGNVTTNMQAVSGNILPTASSQPTADAVLEPTLDEYVVQPGDTLAHIAGKSEIFGDETRWRELWDANPKLLLRYLPVGRKIKIPRDGKRPSIQQSLPTKTTTINEVKPTDNAVLPEEYVVPPEDNAPVQPSTTLSTSEVPSSNAEPQSPDGRPVAPEEVSHTENQNIEPSQPKTPELPSVVPSSNVVRDL